MKNILKISLLFILVVMLVTIASRYLSHPRQQTLATQTKLVQASVLGQSEASTSGMVADTNIKPIEFTRTQLQQYYQVYKNPFVINLRRALNGYLDGTNVGMDDPARTITLDKETVAGTTAGLAAFDREYYKSEFIIYAMNDSLAGGKDISIIFQDKPDKLFTAWVYHLANGAYDLREFWQNPNITEERMKEIRLQYKQALDDKSHSI